MGSRKKLTQAFAVVSGLFGVVLLVFVLSPLVSYELYSREKFPKIISPVVKDSFKETIQENDYTKASNWFPSDTGVGKDDFAVSNVSYYNISIPKLGIDKAVVGIGGEDLSENLIQYPGTAAPGKRGNSVIFGHSILPAFYNPKNYLAIFSTLPTLEAGDDIFVDYDGISYRYQVEELIEVFPRDIQILEQNTSDSYISLVTCTPPGHPGKPKRLIVRARVAPLAVDAKM